MPGGAERPQSPSLQSSQHANKSLFPSTPTFAIETFSRSDFNVKEFIESLSDSASSSNRRSGHGGQAFDPRPLIRSLEQALHRLSELSGDLELKETELSTAVRRAESQHSSNVQLFGKSLDKAIQSFRGLDKSLSESSKEADAGGGSTALKIGERLEELDRQRIRAQDARFLVQCWLDVSERGELFSLQEYMRHPSAERKIRCAQIARQLLRISQRLDPSYSSALDGEARNSVNGAQRPDQAPKPKYNTREIVEKFRESLEKDLLRQFDDSYRRADFPGMRECADVLEDFNGGANVIGTFVNQHQFFIDRAQLITEEVGSDTEMWDTLADPDSEPPGIEPSLQSLIDEVKTVVQDESAIIKKAFSYYEIVLGRFLQRVFQQSVQQRLEMVLEKASAISTLAFLRSLQASRAYLSTLIDDLKAHGLSEHPEPLSSQTALVLDQQFDDLFVPYFVATSYIEREKRNLEELYSSLLFKFTVYHSRKKKTVPTTFLASLAKSGSEMLASARDAYVDRLDSSDLAPQQKAMLLRVAGLKDTDSAKKQMETDLSDADGKLEIGNAKRMLRWLAEAVGRGLELSARSETPRDVSAMLDLLLANLGHLYLEVALDAAIEAASAQESSKNEPDLTYLDDLHSAITVMHLMNMCINTVLVPLAASNTLIRREMEKNTDLAMGHLEEKVNTIMQRTIDVSVAWVSKLLAGQKKTDFRPKEDNDGGTSAWQLLQTPTCLSIFNFLSRVHTLASKALSPSPNLTAFLTELAVNVRGQLLEHFKKFQVSAAGGLMVTKDMSKYNELLRSWSLDPSFEPSLEVLTMIGNIFVIGPEALGDRLKGTPGASSALWEKGDLLPYVMKRDDAGSVAIQSVVGIL